MRGNIAEQVGDHTLRQVVGFNRILKGQLPATSHKTPMAADHPLHQPRMGEVVEAHAFAVTLPAA